MEQKGSKIHVEENQELLKKTRPVSIYAVHSKVSFAE